MNLYSTSNNKMNNLPSMQQQHQSGADSAIGAARADNGHGAQHQQQQPGYPQHGFGASPSQMPAAYATNVVPPDFYLYNQAAHCQYGASAESGSGGGAWSNADAMASQHQPPQHPYLSFPGMEYGAAGFGGLAPAYNMWSAGGAPWSQPQDFGEVSWSRNGAAAVTLDADRFQPGCGHVPAATSPRAPAADLERQSALRTLDRSFKQFGIGSAVAELAGAAAADAPPGSELTPPASGAATSWAKIASQPAKNAVPAPVAPKKASAAPGRGTPGVLPRPSMHWDAGPAAGRPPAVAGPLETGNPETDKIVRELAARINPAKFEVEPRAARFFVIKSYSEDDIHRSIKYGIWCSTEHGNKKLDAAFRQQADARGAVFLFFSVNGSGHFCGLARMASAVDYESRAGVWCQDKWRGKFQVDWLYVKDVPNNQLRHIRLETNENKPVTNSRDATEVPPDKGRAVLKVIHCFRHQTSIFDDFTHYERREVEVIAH